jgi:hypothetical protein
MRTDDMVRTSWRDRVGAATNRGAGRTNR